MAEAATLEPPVTEKPPVVPISELAGGFQFKGGLGDILDSLPKIGEKPETVTPPVETPKVEEKKPEVATPPVDPKAPVTETPKADAPKTSEVESLAILRKRVDSEKAEKEALKLQYEELKKQHEEYTQKAPLTVAEEAKILREQYAKEKAERERLDTDLKASNYERSAEYRDKYIRPIQENMGNMIALAVEAGIPQAEATAAVNGWNQGAFKEWATTNMDEFQRTQFSIAMHAAATTHKQGQVALAQANQNWEAMEKQKAEQAKLQQETRSRAMLSQADRLVEDFAAQEFLKEKPEVVEEIRANVRSVAEGKFDPMVLMQQAALIPVMKKVIETHKSSLEQAEAKIAELEKKVAEQGAFIGKETSSAPVPGNGTAPAADPNAPFVPPWLDVKVG